MSCLSSLVLVHQKTARLFRLQSIALLLNVQIPRKMLILRTALKWMFPLFSVNTGVDKTKDQSWKVCKLLSACQPRRIARWRHLQRRMLHHGWNIFLLGVCIFGILLLMGHHRQDYQKHCCLLLHSPPLRSCSQASPTSSFFWASWAEDKPRQAISTSCCASARQLKLRHVSAALLCFSSTPVMDASSASVYKAISLAAFLGTKFTF